MVAIAKGPHRLHCPRFFALGKVGFPIKWILYERKKRRKMQSFVLFFQKAQFFAANTFKHKQNTSFFDISHSHTFQHFKKDGGNKQLYGMYSGLFSALVAREGKTTLLVWLSATNDDSLLAVSDGMASSLALLSAAAPHTHPRRSQSPLSRVLQPPRQ